MIKITTREIDILSRYIYEKTGIVIKRDKAYLLQSRLQPVMKELACSNYSELYLKIKSDKSGKLTKQTIDAITTNETFFFRDEKPFSLLRNKIIPDLIDRRKKDGAYTGKRLPLRIWSAACSTGQEVYSIAMTLAEILPVRDYDIHILGTDISDKAIAAASYGKYNAFEVQRGLPSQLRAKYFTPVDTGFWRIKDEIRAMAEFKKINLLRPLGDHGKFDAIFCRNVAIYFSGADKVKLFNNLGRFLEPDGALILGGSETLSGITTGFETKNYLRSIYYQLQESSAAGRPSQKTHAAAAQDIVYRPLKKADIPPRLSDSTGVFSSRPSPHRGEPVPASQRPAITAKSNKPGEKLPTSSKRLPAADKKGSAEKAAVGDLPQAGPDPMTDSVQSTDAAKNAHSSGLPQRQEPKKSFLAALHDKSKKGNTVSLEKSEKSEKREQEKEPLLEKIKRKQKKQVGSTEKKHSS